MLLCGHCFSHEGALDAEAAPELKLPLITGFSSNCGCSWPEVVPELRLFLSRSCPKAEADL
jgi:hypothetical protein